MLFSPLLAAFLKERYEKDDFYFRVYDTYTPNYHKPQVTRKFYSKYEMSVNVANPQLVEKIQKVKYGVPRDRYSWPATVNQSYGWFHEPLTSVDKGDHRYYHPRRSPDFIKHQLRLQQDEAGFPKPKFAGIPFKVQ